MKLFLVSICNWIYDECSEDYLVNDAVFPKEIFTVRVHADQYVLNTTVNLLNSIFVENQSNLYAFRISSEDMFEQSIKQFIDDNKLDCGYPVNVAYNEQSIMDWHYNFAAAIRKKIKTIEQWRELAQTIRVGVFFKIQEMLINEY